jgi:hypothetical protein
LWLGAEATLTDVVRLFFLAILYTPYLIVIARVLKVWSQEPQRSRSATKVLAVYAEGVR